MLEKSCFQRHPLKPIQPVIALSHQATSFDEIVDMTQLVRQESVSASPCSLLATATAY